MSSMATSIDIGADLDAASMTPVPYVLSFTDLCYSVRNRRDGGLLGSFLPLSSCSNGHVSTDSPSTNTNTNNKPLLSGISGEAREGELFAIMGASGSGKSTLIDALAGRIARDSLHGSVTLNGEPIHGRRLRAISAYVMQEDLLHPMLTVRETLLFSAELRLSRALSPASKRERVEALLDQLGLSSAADTIIGDQAHRGVSGGERRRVSISTDIVHDPILLFLDEPTSGLDSSSALMVVNVLRSTALSGSVVVLTIHQPSARILAILGKLLLLSHGRAVYAGTPAGLKPFFSEFIGSRHIPENENPAEMALDTVQVLERQPEGSAPLADFNARRWQHRRDTKEKDTSTFMPLELAVAKSISRGKLMAGSGSAGMMLSSSSSSVKRNLANPVETEVWVLTKRSFTNTRRMPELFGTRLVTMTLTGLILATIFFRLDDTPKGVHERLSFLALAMSTLFYVSADALPVFIEERHIYMRETAHNAYRRISYVLANTAVSFPPLVILSLVFAVTTFFPVGLAGGGVSFTFYSLVVLACMWSGTGFVMFLSAAVPQLMQAFTMVTSIFAYFLLFAGFFINRDRIPRYWIWFHYMSLIKYPYQAAMQNEFSDATRCFTRGTQVFDDTPIAAMSEAVKMKVLTAISNSVGTNVTASTCIVTGADVLAQQAVTDLGMWTCLLVTALSRFLFRVMFYLTLLVTSKNIRT